MIGDETISGNPHLIHINDFFKKLDEDGAILPIQENRSPLRPLFITWYHASGYCILKGLLIRSDYHFTE